MISCSGFNLSLCVSSGTPWSLMCGGAAVCGHGHCHCVAGPQKGGSVPLPTPTPSHAGSESALRIPQGWDHDSMREQLEIDQLIANSSTKHNHTPCVT